ncbi:hypothetical protein BDR07DRAFT_1488310 [Suillus spraguei]|nr:hypothetical protein BDR07DRAFT_1488310 [Suillus spraguei]
MSQDSCTLNADGTLKDASDIVFYNDPDDNTPLPQVPSTGSTRNAFSVLLKAGHSPATVTAGSRRSGHPSKPSARICDVDNACGLLSSSGTRKCALSSAMDRSAPVKKVSTRILSPLDSDNEDIDIPSSAPDLVELSSDELIPQLDDDEEADNAMSDNGGVTQTVPKSERTADVQTVFTCIPDVWVCTLCKAASEPTHKHTFRGGTSTLQTHIVCYKQTHFQVYKQRCDAACITMHSHAIPPDEDLTAMQQTLDTILVPKCPVFTKEGLLEYIMELIVTEDEALQLIDKPAF